MTRAFHTFGVRSGCSRTFITMIDSTRFNVNGPFFFFNKFFFFAFHISPKQLLASSSPAIYKRRTTSECTPASACRRISFLRRKRQNTTGLSCLESSSSSESLSAIPPVWDFVQVCDKNSRPIVLFFYWHIPQRNRISPSCKSYMFTNRRQETTRTRRSYTKKLKKKKSLLFGTTKSEGPPAAATYQRNNEREVNIQSWQGLFATQSEDYELF